MRNFYVNILRGRYTARKRRTSKYDAFTQLTVDGVRERDPSVYPSDFMMYTC